MNYVEFSKNIIEPWTDLPMELKVLCALIVFQSLLEIKKNFPGLTTLPWEQKNNANIGYDEDYEDLNPFLQRLKRYL